MELADEPHMQVPFLYSRVGESIGGGGGEWCAVGLRQCHKTGGSGFDSR
jgi:hypothetical protein